MILEARDDIAVVGEAADGQEAVEVAATTDPDVVLMDVRMPRLDGIEATRRVVDSGSRARVVMLTTFRPRRAGLRGAAGRRERFPAQGHPPGGVGGGRTRDGPRRGLLAPTVTRRLLDRFAAGLPAEPA